VAGQLWVRNGDDVVALARLYYTVSLLIF
jgi:hypothetical protein